MCFLSAIGYSNCQLLANRIKQNLLQPSKRCDEIDYLDRLRGVEAYRAVNAVVILTENVQHKNDPVWRNILDKWRVGVFEQTDVDLVNRIGYHENWIADRARLRGYCPIIVTSNALRVEFNTSALRSFCGQCQIPLHRFKSTVTRPRFALSVSQLKALRGIRDDKTSNMPLELDLAIGAPMQCTKNISSTLKLANGTIGYVVGFQPAIDDIVHHQAINGIDEYVHSKPPTAVYLQLKDFPTLHVSPELPPGVVPVCPRTEKGIQIKLPNRSFSVSITQAPLVLTFSLTTEKCQGLTVDKMVLAPLRHQTRRIPQKSSLYVAVTRVKSLNQLYLMAPLTKEFLEYFKPRSDALEETVRLMGIEAASAVS